MTSGMKSLGARIVLFFVTLLVIVQGVSALLVLRANGQIARQTIAQALEQGERIFKKILEQNQLRLEQGAAILSADFAFRQAIASNNTATIQSVLRNHGGRLGANVMMLVSLENEVRADTGEESRVGKPFAFPTLIAQAAASGKASSIVVLDHHLYQLVVVPVLAPVPIAWVGLAFEVNDTLARELRQQTGLEVSFLSRGNGRPWELHASTLDPFLRDALRNALTRPEALGAGLREIALAGAEYETRLAAVDTQASSLTVAALQRPLSEGLAPFEQVSTTFFWLTVGGALVLFFGSLAIARSVTRPVQRLAEAARRVEQGDYTHPLEVTQKDELGQLAVSFNHMLDGIVSREREILRLAYEDGLTALPNRAMFNEQLEQAVRTARRANQTLSVLLLDMDRFKAINDTLGHRVGDQALREVGRRVRKTLRDSDVVARLGGDEFAVLLATGGVDRAPTIVAQKILKALEDPLDIEGQSMDVTCSIGIARYPEHGDDANALVRAADVAMYNAKRSKGGFTVYDSAYDERRQEFLTLLGELRRAVENDQLVLHYQPKLDLAANKVTAVESLVRWQHPERGFIPPNDFIPFAEQTGYISAITEWVLKRAIAQCAHWHRTGLSLKMSVNVSARDLRQEEVLVKLVSDALHLNELPAALLCLEVTESGLMDDPRSAQSTLRKLRELGVATSIDDYGTGYSSLSYIRQLAVNELKIDRTFVSGMEADQSNAAIVRSTIELGHNLGLTVAAEGVETEHELTELRRHGCDLAQGYYLSRPLAAEALEAWLVKQSGYSGVRLARV